MTLEEMRDLLATVAAYDGRAVDRRVIEDWHNIAGSLDHGLGVAAVRYWYTFNRGYMQPHDLATSAATVSGLDRPDSVTARRLAHEPLAHEIRDSVLAPMLELDRKAEE